MIDMIKIVFNMRYGSMYVYFMFYNLNVKILHLQIFLLKCLASIVGLCIIYQFHSQAPKAPRQETDGKQMD